MPPQGFWARLGPLASVDWCEPNYVHSPYVAEWYNTWSSVPIALFGLLCVLWARWPRFRADPRFLLGGFAVFVVGVGSTAFHGTLLRSAQALDELPMIYSGLAFLYIVRHRIDAEARRRRYWQVGLLSYAAAFTVAYFALPAYFVFFIVSYAAAVTLLVLWTARVSFVTASDRPRRRLFLLSAGSYVGGVFLLWVPEHVLLPCDHPIQGLQLHAWFHLTSALGSYAWLLWAAYDRQAVKGRRPARTFPVPG